ncbi:NAD-dependent epimerase/dehydratase family protein [Prochlorococcus marinus]|jgi:nucleoside-diphosphate-sugar epimerase|uniref:NAD-dependent epimerase/dehydratase domain-containing protein n=1 Tax=Prochlorococcus marinus (strain MIT 9301) TaxID=167546 RepID=A3PE74_PROM0|nr:NAD(P)-dependent oxidoreductase [Prochlorococcus marinus]ABO18049.1 Hypothetical protein P9301_14261 [Prochlorococcus marinus str. MIT 9301]
MKEKILISGCTGLTGKYATLKILNKYKNIEVIGFSRDINKSFSSNSFTFLQGDANKTSFWRELLKKFRPNTILINSNIRHFLPFLEAIDTLDIEEFPRVVIVSTTGIFSKFNSYNFLYKQIEGKIKSYRGNFLILRPSLIYGSKNDKNISKLIRFVHKFRFSFSFGSGLNYFQPIFYKDLGWAISEVLLNKNISGEYNLTGKNCITFIEILKLISFNLKKNLINIKLPLKLTGNILLFVEKYLRFTILPITSEQVFRMSENKCYSHLKAKEDFGFEPISFQDGIKLQIDEMIVQGDL